MIDRFLNILKIDSTSGNEGELAIFIANTFKTEKCEVEFQVVKPGIFNLLFKWGNPTVTFCTHLDTVPPYFPPSLEGTTVRGRGSCDAKGQIMAMYTACLELEKEGNTGFGLLLLAGEETGSHGAKVANELVKGCEFVIVGEPTQNKMIRAGKGTLLFKVLVSGRSAHSGYPHLGANAVSAGIELLSRLNKQQFPSDELLGEVTWNTGALTSANAHNVISDMFSFNIYFRTTFNSHNVIENILRQIANDVIALFPGCKIEIEAAGGDTPISFFTLEGFEYDTVAYGSDAPKLFNLGERLLYGPGSISTAHTIDEHIDIKSIEQAINDYKRMYYDCNEIWRHIRRRSGRSEESN